MNSFSKLFQNIQNYVENENIDFLVSINSLENNKKLRHFYEKKKQM